jgi:type VI secretion system secreted protein Hcp
VAIYLTLDGIEGPINDPIKKAIELHSIQFGVGCGLTKQKGLGFKREGEPSLSEVTVSKVTDKASTNLFKEVCGGGFFKKGEISVTKLIDKKPVPFFKLTMEEVFVSGWSISSGGDSPSESLSLAFNKIKVCFNPEKDGKEEGFVFAGWSHLKDEEW